MATESPPVSPLARARLYLLFEVPWEGGDLFIVPESLPQEIAADTIELSLWSASEKAILRSHRAYAVYEFALQPQPVAAFLEAYRYLATLSGLVGVANPHAATAHTAKWIHRLFADQLEAVALETPPLHLWTGLLPLQVEVNLAKLWGGHADLLWLRTVGYDQFGLPDLAHPLRDLREVGWVHSIFELVFDWAYHAKAALVPGIGLEVPERGRFLVDWLMPGVLGLWPYEEDTTLSSASSF